MAAAVELLDVEGLTGLTMRRLAARLEAGTMSLYEYVNSRDDVLDLALDSVMAEIDPDLDDDAGWRHVLTALLSESRQVMRRHAWVPAVAGTRPLLGPNALARSERCYAALARAGLDGPALIAAVSAASSYVSGFVAAENVWRSSMRNPGAEAELRRRAQALIDEQSDRFPALSEHAQLDRDDFDEGFALGLSVVLDGIEAQLDRGS